MVSTKYLFGTTFFQYQLVLKFGMILVIKQNIKISWVNIFYRVPLFIFFLLLIGIFVFPTETKGEQKALPENRTAATDSLKTEPADTNYRRLDRTIQNEAFRVGEKLTFVIRYGFIHAGNATMEVKRLDSIEHRPVYHIVSTARSKKTFDLFFKVRDSVQTWIDTQGLFSWKFIKKLREGAYKFDLQVDYHQFEGKADIKMIRYQNEEPLRARSKKDFELEIPPYVLDIFSSFYYVRTQNLRIGRPIYLTNHDNKKIYNLKVIIQRKEIVKVKAGKFRCIMIQPVLKGESLFKQKGKLWVWLTDDQYKIPILMKSSAFIGKITTELTDLEGFSLPLPSQIQD